MIKVIGADSKFDNLDPTYINTTSRSRIWSRGLSPFLLGPCPLYNGAPCKFSKNMENAWQFAKVYPEHIDDHGDPNQEYWNWAHQGWLTMRGIRYPKGKGAIPLYSYWNDEKLNYIEARKKIYIPLYKDAVLKSHAFQKLIEIYKKYGKITLWGFDGYDHHLEHKSLDDVINDEKRKMGHMFVLAMMLEEIEV